MSNVTDSHLSHRHAVQPQDNHSLPLHDQSLPMFSNGADNYDRSDMIYLNHPNDVSNSDMWMDPNFCNSIVSKNSYPPPNLDLLGLLSSGIDINGHQDNFDSFPTTHNPKNQLSLPKSNYSAPMNEMLLDRNIINGNHSNLNLPPDTLLQESSIAFPDNLINSTTDLSGLECLNVLANSACDRDVPGHWDNINLMGGAPQMISQTENNFNSQNSSPEDFPDSIFAQMVEVLPCYKCNKCNDFITFIRDEMVSHLKTLHLKLNSMPILSQSLPPWNTVANCGNYSNQEISRTSQMNNPNVSQGAVVSSQNYSCDKCSRSFFTLDELRKHHCRETIQQQFPNPEPIKPTNSHLIPIAPKNGTTPVVKIPSTPIAVKRKRAATSHKKSLRERQKAQQGLYICEFKGCNVRFRLMENFSYHKKCHKKCHADGKKTAVNINNNNTTTNSNVAFACPECPFECPTWNSMAGHVWRRHSIDLELHACDQCSYRTSSSSKLINLHKRTHEEFRTYICPKCNHGFKTYKILWTHKRSCMNLITTPVKRKPRAHCNICNMSFSRTRLLSIHYESVHQNIRPYSCSTCGYTANRPTTLKMHMRSHSGEKPFACEFCQFRTGDRSTLRRHNMMHSGEKPYKCLYCSYGCIQSSTFKMHLKKKHPDKSHEKLFACTLCNFQTVKKNLLTVHVATHTKPEENNSSGSNGMTNESRNSSSSSALVVQSMADSQIMFEAVKCSIQHRDIT